MKQLEAVLKSHNASDSLSGYLYQLRFALMATVKEGYRRANLEVSLECFDDIAFQRGALPSELLQTKHHRTGRHSLSDKSADLWKTLGIWSKIFHSDPQAAGSMKFFLITTSPVPEGAAASFLRQELRDEVKAGELLLRGAKSSQNRLTKKSRSDFLSLSTQDRKNLLSRITVVDQAPDMADVNEELTVALKPAAPVGKAQLVVERLEGWWLDIVAKHLEGHPESIPFTLVEAKIDEIRMSLTPDSLPIDYGNLFPTAEEVSALDRRPFVEQLRMIQVGEISIGYAIRDFHRAYTQRSRWIREDLIFTTELENYERQLVESWQPVFEATREDLPPDCTLEEMVMAGRDIYRWVEREVDIPLRTVRERFICHGSFHMLANRSALGWHPEWATRLSTLVTAVPGGA